MTPEAPRVRQEDSLEDIVGRARRFAEAVNWLIEHITEEEYPAVGPHLQLRIIHRTNYKPGRTERGRWLVGYFRPAGGGNGEWEPPNRDGLRDGATMFEAVERFYELHHPKEERDHDPS